MWATETSQVFEKSKRDILCPLHEELIEQIDIAKNINLGRRAVCDKCQDIQQAVNLNQAIDHFFTNYSSEAKSSFQLLEKSLTIVITNVETRIEALFEELKKLELNLNSYKEKLNQERNKIMARFSQNFKLTLSQIQNFAEYLSQITDNNGIQQQTLKEEYYEKYNFAIYHQLVQISTKEQQEMDIIFNNLKNHQTLLKSSFHQFQISQALNSLNTIAFQTSQNAKLITVDYNGSILAVAFAETIEIFQLNQRNHVIFHQAHEKEITAIRLSNNGQWLATSGLDQQLKFWKLQGVRGLELTEICPFQYEEVFIIQPGTLKTQVQFLTLNWKEIAIWIKQGNWEKLNAIQTISSPETIVSVNLDFTFILVGNKQILDIYTKQEKKWMIKQNVTFSVAIIKLIFLESGFLVQTQQTLQIWQYIQNMYQIKDVYDLNQLVICKSKNYLLTQQQSAFLMYEISLKNQFQLNLTVEIPSESNFALISADGEKIIFQNRKNIKIIQLNKLINLPQYAIVQQ